LRRLKEFLGEAPLLLADTGSLFLEKKDTPALFPTFHNELPESNKQAKSCHCLQLTLSEFATWKQTAFSSLSCFFIVALGAVRGQTQKPIPHAPLSLTTLSGFTGGALDPDEGNTHLFARNYQSFRECVNKGH